MIDELTSDDFTAFFRDVHGRPPFPWQCRLTVQVLGRGVWPKVIDLPTGAGKTAVLDTAVFAMAARKATSPRRIIFVIDRRIVVDQVCQRAERIRDRIAAGETPILHRVRERLCALSDAGSPLGVAALRGGVPVDHEWAQYPDQPWVVVSTVDQFGSRLLFRGYGVSPGMRPVHAGLAGNDCLVILDEVHLSVPFSETLAQVSALPAGVLPRRFAIVEMSATPSDRNAERFKLDPSTDLNACEELKRRVEARKQAELVSVRNRDALPTAVLKIVQSIARSHKTDLGIRSVGVVVNRVRSARETHNVLARAGYATHLMTGRMRPLDRVDALDTIGPIVDPDGECPSDALTVVVATQAIEVGADFSFDALITECAAVDSLRQRFGRLDRRGTCFARTGRAARAWIIGPKSVVDSRRPDPIYGGATKRTWEELKRREQSDQSTSAQRPCESSPTTQPRRGRARRSCCKRIWTPGRKPVRNPSCNRPSGGFFTASTSSDRRMSRYCGVGSLVGRLAAGPAPSGRVPSSTCRRDQGVLSGSDEVEVADVDTASAGAGNGSSSQTNAAGWVRWIGFGKNPEHIEPDKIRLGDVLIVDPTRGGLTAGTWDPSSTTPVTDLGDAAQSAYGRRVTLRLDPRLLDTVPPAAPNDAANVDVPARDRIDAWLKESVDAGDQPAWRAATAERLVKNGFDVVPVGLDDADSDAGYYLLAERHFRTHKPVVDPATLDGSDEVGSGTGAGVTLRQHLDGVSDRAARIAERLGLDEAVVEDLRIAAGFTTSARWIGVSRINW